jgi:hypothetical protein
MWPSWRYCPEHGLEKLRKTEETSARIADNPMKILAGYLPSAILALHRFARLLEQ